MSQVTGDVLNLSEGFNSGYKPMKYINRSQPHEQDDKTESVARGKHSWSSVRYITCITKNGG
jgi:hypothetical protein